MASNSRLELSQAFSSCLDVSYVFYRLGLCIPSGFNECSFSSRVFLVFPSKVFRDVPMSLGVLKLFLLSLGSLVLSVSSSRVLSSPISFL